jgi:hypothetical protein
MIFFYLASPIDGSEDDPELLIQSGNLMNATNFNKTISDSGHI